jgi:hypothetical protein
MLLPIALIFVSGSTLAIVGAVLVLMALFALKRASSPSSEPPAESSGPVVRRNWLLERRDGGGGTSWHIGERTATAGRAATNFVQIDSQGVSRTHCQLRPVSEGLQLVDMTSSNGTLLNGKAVRDAILTDHDVLTLGDTNLIYRAAGDFGANAGFEMKKAGKPSQESTSVAGPRDMDKIVEAHLVFNESGENFIVASEKLGMTEAELKDLLGE